MIPLYGIFTDASLHATTTYPCIPPCLKITGYPGTSQVPDTSLLACHGLRTPAALHVLTDYGHFVLASSTFKPSPTATALSRLYQHFRVCGHPYGLQGSLCTLHLYCSTAKAVSATGATLDMGGWLILTQPGLSPSKKRQAALGARTCELTSRLERSGMAVR